MTHRTLIAAALFAPLMAGLPGPCVSWAQTSGPSALTSQQPVSEYERSRIEALAEAAGFTGWPRPEARFTAPAIDRSLIGQPERITQESLTYSTVSFGDGLWGKSEQSWRSALKLPGTSDTAATGSRTAGFQVKGDFSIEVTLAPSVQAAQEYLLAEMADNMMPTEGIVAALKAAKRPAGLGDVAFLIESRDGTDRRLRFVRNNVYVSLRADGDFAAEILSVARVIDGRIVSQQPLDYAQLLARRPAVSLGDRVDEGLPYQVASPSGQQVIDVRARVDGQSRSVEQGKVSLPEREARKDVEVIAISRDLLVGTAQQRGISSR